MHGPQQRIAHRLLGLLRRVQPLLQGRKVDFHLGFQDLAQHAVDVGWRSGQLGHGVGGKRIFHGSGVVQHRHVAHHFGLRHRLRCGSHRQRHVEGFLTGGHAVGDGLHRLQVHGHALAIAQRGIQLRQRGVGMVDHRQHGRGGRTTAIEHAVEHALDLPGELAQGAGADQATTALEGVEDAADRTQPVHVVRLHAPGRQQRAEIAHLVIELFQEHLADILVDVLGIVVEARFEAGGFGSHGSDFRCRRRRRSLRIELGRSRTQFGEELRIGLAEIDRRDGIDVDQGHGRGRRGGRGQGLDHFNRRRIGNHIGHVDLPDGLDRRGGLQLQYLDRRGFNGVDDLQHRQLRVVFPVQRQRFHRLQRQHVVGVVQCAVVEVEYHLVGQHCRAIMLGSHRIEHGHGRQLQRSACGVVQRGNAEVLDAVFQHQRVAIIGLRLCDAGQRPLRGDVLGRTVVLEADRIETVEGRCALIGDGRGVMAAQLPLRHARHRRGGGGEQQRCRFGLLRRGCGDVLPAQRAEHQAVVGHRRSRQRIEGEVRQRRRDLARRRCGRLHGDLHRLQLQRSGGQRHTLALDRPQRIRVGLGLGCGAAALGQRPVAQGFQAAAGNVEDVLATRAAVTQRFQVVFQAGHGIGQRVQLAATGHALAADQFGLDVLLHAAQVIGGGAQVEHAQRAGHVAQQARHVLQFGMVPAGFDEGDEMLAGAGEIGDRLMRQHFHRAPVLHRARVVLATATGAQVGDLVVQRRIDIEQRAGDIQQHVFVDLLAAFDHGKQRIALLRDHAAGRAQAHHAQRVADGTQLGHLFLQLLRRTAGTQVQVQGILDLEQFFLDRAADRIEQLSVAAAQAATGVVQLGLGGADTVRREGEQHAVIDAFFATRGTDLVQQRHQHDRNIAVAVLQAFQVIGQQHAATHQRGAGFIAVGHAAFADGHGQLFQFLGHHRRGIQLDHAQGALHLVQVAGADAHAAAVGRVLDEVLDLVPHLAQGLVQLRLDPAQRCMAHRIAQAAHGRAPVAAARRPRVFWRGKWKCFIE